MDQAGHGLVNVAVTSASLPSVTVQVPVPEHPPPDQPAKVLPGLADAYNVTIVPVT